MLRLYDALVSLALWLVLVPRELLAIAGGRSSPGRLASRLGRAPRLAPSRLRLLVLHAVSVGEMAAAGALARAWTERHPEDRILLTAGNADGLAAGQRVAAALPCVVGVVPLPWDRKRAVRKWLGTLQPDLVVVIETEIWPRLFTLCRALGIPLAVASARLYPGDLRRYRLLPKFFRGVLEAVSWVGAQSPLDRARWIGIGAPPDRVETVGNLKYEPPPLPPARGPVKGADRVWILAASTHRGEDEPILRAFARLPTAGGAPQLVLAPRHPRRAAGLVRVARRQGLEAHTLSELERRAPAKELPGRVLVVDRLGWLPGAMSSADLVVLGGTFVPHGGHNPLEAARCGCALLVGPHVENFAAVVSHLTSRGGVRRLVSAEELPAALARLLGDPEERRRLGAAAAAAVAEGRCAARYVQRLDALAGKGPCSQRSGASSGPGMRVTQTDSQR